MRVYRVALADDWQSGPYNPMYNENASKERRLELYTLAEELLSRHARTPSHPIPSRDIGRLYAGDWFYGCESLASLRNWFAGFWRALGDKGYAVWAIDVDNYRPGKYQLAFSSEHVRSMTCHPINRQGRVLSLEN